MIQAKYTFWHILFNITMYTVMAIGVMYAVYFYIKKFNPNFKNQNLQNQSQQINTNQNPMLAMILNRFGHRLNIPTQENNNTNPPAQMTFEENGLQSNYHQPVQQTVSTRHPEIEAEQALMIESSIQLEVGKTLYVARCGKDRFLLASHSQGISNLSKLDSSIPDVTGKSVAENTEPPTQLSPTELRHKRAQQQKRKP